MPRPNTSRRRATPRAGVDRPDSGVAEMTRQTANCERCAEFSRELLELQQRLHALGPAEVWMQVPARSARLKVSVSAPAHVARYATALACFVQVMRAWVKAGHRRDVSGVEHV